MSGFKSKTPPVKLVFSKDNYNKLIQILSLNEISYDEKLSLASKKLKEKLLTYSVPKEDDGMINVDVRFYINEAALIIEQLMYAFKDEIEIEADYVEVLERIRESRKQNNTEDTE